MFQAEDGIRDLVRSRGLGDVYKRQIVTRHITKGDMTDGDSGREIGACFGRGAGGRGRTGAPVVRRDHWRCLLYTSDAADERSSVDLGGRRIIKKKKQKENRDV